MDYFSISFTETVSIFFLEQMLTRVLLFPFIDCISIASKPQAVLMHSGCIQDLPGVIFTVKVADTKICLVFSYIKIPPLKLSESLLLRRLL